MGGKVCPKMEYNSSLQISKEVHLDTLSGFFDYQISENTFTLFKLNAELISY